MAVDEKKQMTKSNLECTSYISSAALQLIRGVTYDLHKLLHLSVAAKPLAHQAAALTHKIFFKSTENDLEFVLAG